jgi:hypothetical protein
MGLSQGDPVEAARRLGDGSITVARGTPGVVLAVKTSGILTTHYSYTVAFTSRGVQATIGDLTDYSIRAIAART